MLSVVISVVMRMVVNVRMVVWGGFFLVRWVMGFWSEVCENGGDGGWG